MNHKFQVHCLWLAAGIVALPYVPAQAAEPAATKEQPAARAPISFRPAAQGAPAVRVTGGSRGQGDTAVTLDVLAPDQTGLTTREQPSLFWYQSKPATAKFELTLLREDKDDPLLQVTVNRAEQAGIHRVKLGDHGVQLKPGVEYRWVVALITDPQNRSSDLVASGSIQRVEASDELKTRLASADKATIPAIYAEAGIWYDALETLSDQIDANPNDDALRAVRADLLKQVGLKAASNAP